MAAISSSLVQGLYKVKCGLLSIVRLFMCAEGDLTGDHLTQLIIQVMAHDVTNYSTLCYSESGKLSNRVAKYTNQLGSLTKTKLLLNLYYLYR